MARTPILFWAALAAIITVGASAQASGQQRVALVIGNSAYQESPLRNPANDARVMGQRLRALGFQVNVIIDADRDAMKNAILDFAGRLRSDTTGLFYYAGHGIQSRGRNYLVPVGAQVGAERALRFEAVDIQAVLEEMALAQNRVNFVILDACRNNPFERRFRGGSRGLAAVDAARGTLIAYATAPGAVAADGDGDNGLYTSELVEALAVPGLKAEEIFKRVRVAVTEKSRGQQVPWESSSLTGDFVFNSKPGPQTARVAAAVPSMTADREAIFWETIQHSDNAADFQAYLDQFPTGTFASLARIRLQALTPKPSDSDRAATGSDRVTELLAAAQSDVAALRLTSPAGNNAYQRYREVLELDPNNAAASSGLVRITERYIALADKAAADERFDKADRYLDNADRVLPGLKSVADARGRLQATKAEYEQNQRSGVAAASASEHEDFGPDLVLAMSASKAALPGPPYEIAIAPLGYVNVMLTWSSFQESSEKVISDAENAIDGNRSFELINNYNRKPAWDLFDSRGRFWSGATAKTARPTDFFEAGAQEGLDAILAINYTTVNYDLEIVLYDMQTRKVYLRHGWPSTLERATEGLLREFINGR